MKPFRLLSIDSNEKKVVQFDEMMAYFKEASVVLKFNHYRLLNWVVVLSNLGFVIA
jgi:hypothetical protein